MLTSWLNQSDSRKKREESKTTVTLKNLVLLPSFKFLLKQLLAETAIWKSKHQHWHWHRYRHRKNFIFALNFFNEKQVSYVKYTTVIFLLLSYSPSKSIWCSYSFNTNSSKTTTTKTSVAESFYLNLQVFKILLSF